MIVTLNEAPWQGSWFVVVMFGKVIVEDFEYVPPPAMSAGRPVLSSTTLNQAALQPTIDGLPDAVLLTSPLPSASTVTFTDLRYW